MRTIHDWFSEYAESHQNSLNKRIHWVCVPAILFSLYGLLSAVPLPIPLPDSLAWLGNLGTVLLIGGLAFYLRLSVPLFVGMVLVSVLVVYGNRMLGALVPLPLWATSLIIFALAWVGQFYGHAVEGKKPSFFKDVQFLMIGPAWVLGFLYRKLGIPY